MNWLSILLIIVAVVVGSALFVWLYFWPYVLMESSIRQDLRKQIEEGKLKCGKCGGGNLKVSMETANLPTAAETWFFATNDLSAEPIPKFSITARLECLDCGEISDA